MSISDSNYAAFAPPKSEFRKQELQKLKREMLEEPEPVISESPLDVAARENGFANHAAMLEEATLRQSAYSARRIAVKRQAEELGLIIPHKHADSPKAYDLI